SCRFIASGSISVMRYNNNNNNQQPASGRMKSGTKLSSTAFLPPVPFLLFSQKSKTSTLAPTSLALLDGSPQKPSAPRNQHPPWFSLSRAKTQQTKPSHLASPLSATV